jgi:prepilin-type N-terminal cleavage/methylation domain-containing protein
MAGFTLIELAVTMVVLVILATAALPAYREFFERYRLRGAVDDITSVIATARAGAVKADRDVRVSFGRQHVELVCRRGRRRGAHRRCAGRRRGRLQLCDQQPAMRCRWVACARRSPASMRE